MTKKFYLDDMANSYFDDGLNGVIKYDDSDRAYFDDVDTAKWWQVYFNAVSYLSQLTDDDGESYLIGASDCLNDYDDYIAMAEDIKSHGESREVLAKYNDNVKAD